jgi:hypothetical protein
MLPVSAHKREYANWFVLPDKKPTVSAESNSDTKPLAVLARGETSQNSKNVAHS